MFVVSTVQQLEDAIRESVREVLVVGKLAPKVLEKLVTPLVKSERENVAVTDFFLDKLVNKFKYCVIQDNKDNAVAIVCQRLESGNDKEIVELADLEKNNISINYFIRKLL